MKRISLPFLTFLVIAVIIGNRLINTIKPSPYFPSLNLVALALGELIIDKEFLMDCGISIYRIALGYWLACFIGIGFGLLIGTDKRLQQLFGPIIEFCRPLPIPAIIPLVIIFLGMGNSMKILIIGFACLWPIMTSTIKATRDAEESFIDIMKMFGIQGISKYLIVILPAASPQIFAGLRISVPIAVIGSILSELVGQSDGIGASLIFFQRTFQIEKMYAALLLITLLNYLLNSLLVYCQNIFLIWRD